MVVRPCVLVLQEIVAGCTLPLAETSWVSQLALAVGPATQGMCNLYQADILAAFIFLYFPF